MIKPLKNNVLIDIHKMSDKVFTIIDDNQAVIEKATVLEIGSEVTLVKKGDIIYFKKYNLDTIEEGFNKYNLIPEEDIKGIEI